ncbi:hypothetical protein ACSQ67_002934 [Phaseolus vulgaris]
MQSWDPTLVNPCTWLRVSCDSNNNVVLRMKIDYKTFHCGHLFGNKLSGNIPQELGSLKNLISMDLSKNKLEGNIPKSFANLKSLKSLWLDNNELSGTIPSAVVTLLKHLVVFNVSNNHFSNPPIDVTAQSFSMQSFENKKFKGARMKEVVA